MSWAPTRFALSFSTTWVYRLSSLIGRWSPPGTIRMRPWLCPVTGVASCTRRRRSASRVAASTRCGSSRRTLTQPSTKGRRARSMLRSRVIRLGVVSSVDPVGLRYWIGCGSTRSSQIRHCEGKPTKCSTVPERGFPRRSSTPSETPAWKQHESAALPNGRGSHHASNSPGTSTSVNPKHRSTSHPSSPHTRAVCRPWRQQLGARAARSLSGPRLIEYPHVRMRARSSILRRRASFRTRLGDVDCGRQATTLG